MPATPVNAQPQFASWRWHEGCLSQALDTPLGTASCLHSAERAWRLMAYADAPRDRKQLLVTAVSKATNNKTSRFRAYP
eukprot:6210340-Pleurochrysis_carterae.AAC.4